MRYFGIRYFLGDVRRSGWTRPFIFRLLSPVGTCESRRLTLFATIEPSRERRKNCQRAGLLSPKRSTTRQLRDVRKRRVARGNLLIFWEYGDWFWDSGHLCYIVCYRASRESGKRPITLIFCVKIFLDRGAVRASKLQRRVAFRPYYEG